MTSYTADLWGWPSPGSVGPYKILLSRVNRSEEIRPKAISCSIFSRFSNFDKCRPEVAGDGAALNDVGVDVHPKLGDSRLNNGRITRLFGHPDPFYAFLYSI